MLIPICIHNENEHIVYVVDVVNGLLMYMIYYIYIYIYIYIYCVCANASVG